MATSFDTIVAFAFGIALLLGLWLVLIAGSVLVWEVMRRWSSAHIDARAQRFEVRAQRAGLPSVGAAIGVTDPRSRLSRRWRRANMRWAG